ncbi:MAG: LUD domain-containing protein [Chloroflexota bacterium]|nr:LUD domain-containing protein [Chloroflexota bacterium]
MPEITTETAVWSRFTAKAELVGALVVRTGSHDTAASVFRVAGGELRRTTSVAARFPRLAASVKSRPAHAGEPGAEVVTVAEFAVAETGSVALHEPAGDRGACFLSERLWVLVSERDIVATLDEGMQRMHDLVRGGARHPLLMTGPSRTADIERVLTIGVHGPRALVIVVVGEQ